MGLPQPGTVKCVLPDDAGVPMHHEPAPGAGCTFVTVFDGPFDVQPLDDKEPGSRQGVVSVGLKRARGQTEVPHSWSENKTSAGQAAALGGAPAPTGCG